MVLRALILSNFPILFDDIKTQFNNFINTLTSTNLRNIHIANLFIGYNKSNNDEWNKIYVIKTDENFNTIWTKNYGTTHSDNKGYSIIEFNENFVRAEMGGEEEEGQEYESILELWIDLKEKTVEYKLLNLKTSTYGEQLVIYQCE